MLHYYSERPGLEHIVIGIVKVIGLYRYIRMDVCQLVVFVRAELDACAAAYTFFLAHVVAPITTNAGTLKESHYTACEWN